MTGEMNEVNRSIGALQSSVEALNRNWAEQYRKATEGRHDLYRKVEELKGEIIRMTGRVDHLTHEVGEIKPTVKGIVADKNQSKGANNIIRIIWGVLVAGIGAVAYVINDWIHLFWPPRH